MTEQLQMPRYLAESGQSDGHVTSATSRSTEGPLYAMPAFRQ